MTNRARSTTKKFLAAVGLALGLASLGLVASPGTAAADGHNIDDEDATWGAPDGAEQRGMSWVPAVNEGDMGSSVFSNDTSSDSPHASSPASSYPEGGSYPATPSWPGAGWGVADN